MCNLLKSILKKLSIGLGVVLALGMNAVSVQAQDVWQDTLYVRITDSLFILEDKSISFDVEIMRSTNHWADKDTILGDFDLYFTYSDKAFSSTGGTPPPALVDLSNNMDYFPSASRANLLLGETKFHAGRFYIGARADHVPGDKFGIPSNRWIKLCQVKVPMKNGNQNPGISWDLISTAAMTASGKPIILKLAGDIIKNPNPVVGADRLVVTPEMQCQGEDVYVYVENAVTSGDGLTYTWSDAVVEGTWDKLGEYTTSSGITDAAKGYKYEILGEGDTLVIRNSSDIVDGLFFQCVLTDASLTGLSKTVDAKVALRDSLYGFFAAEKMGGVDAKIDTVAKCVGSPASLYVYLFGPTKSEMTNNTNNEFGDIITIHYAWQDAAFNTRRDSVKLDRNKDRVETIPSDYNPLKKDVFVYEAAINRVGKIWVEAINVSAHSCNNGMGFAKYDTLVIQEIEGELNYDLSPITASLKQIIELDARTPNKEKPYKISLKLPGANGSEFEGASYYNGYASTYTAGTAAGFDTLIYTTTVGKCEIVENRPIEVVAYSYLTLKVFLEGTYAADSLNCSYAAKEAIGDNVFPRNKGNIGRLVSPYDETCILHDSLKYITDIETEKTISDWIYIKLRKEESPEIPGNYIDSISAFLLKDGSVCGIDGKPIRFKNIEEKVFVEIKHRTHLKVTSKNAITLKKTVTAGGYDVNFTKADQVFGGKDVLIDNGGKQCLVAGQVRGGKNNLGVADITLLRILDGSPQYQYDINGDGRIDHKDLKFARKNDGAYVRP